MANGVYPPTSLRDARWPGGCQEAPRHRPRSFLRQKGRENKDAASSNTFVALASEVAAKKTREGKAEGTIERFEWLTRLAGPVIGERPIADISASEVLAALRTVESRGRHETAKKMRSAIGEVFRFAIATGRAENEGRLRSVLQDFKGADRDAGTAYLSDLRWQICKVAQATQADSEKSPAAKIRILVMQPEAGDEPFTKECSGCAAQLTSAIARDAEHILETIDLGGRFGDQMNAELSGLPRWRAHLVGNRCIIGQA